MQTWTPDPTADRRSQRSLAARASSEVALNIQGMIASFFMPNNSEPAARGTFTAYPTIAHADNDPVPVGMYLQLKQPLARTQAPLVVCRLHASTYGTVGEGGRGCLFVSKRVAHATNERRCSARRYCRTTRTTGCAGTS